MTQDITIPDLQAKSAGWGDLFYAMVESSAIAQFFIDDHGTVAYLNRKGHDVFRQLEPALGFGPEQLVNGPVLRLAEAIPELQPALCDKTSAPRCRHAAVGEQWLKWNIAHIAGSDGQPCGAAVSLEIVTDERQLVAGLQREVQSLTKTLGATAARMGQVSSAVTDAQHEAGVSQDAMQRVRDAGRQTGEAVQATWQIAQQANMLALNAAIAVTNARDDTGQRFARLVVDIQDLARRIAAVATDLRGQVKALDEETAAADAAAGKFNEQLQRIHELTAVIAGESYSC